ncbi:unnamed protein product [Caretta caretta]
MGSPRVTAEPALPWYQKQEWGNSLPSNHHTKPLGSVAPSSNTVAARAQVLSLSGPGSPSTPPKGTLPHSKTDFTPHATVVAMSGQCPRHSSFFTPEMLAFSRGPAQIRPQEDMFSYRVSEGLIQVEEQIVSVHTELQPWLNPWSRHLCLHWNVPQPANNMQAHSSHALHAEPLPSPDKLHWEICLLRILTGRPEIKVML